MGIEQYLRGGSVYLDTNIFIYAVEDFPEYAVLVRKIFKIIDQGVSFIMKKFQNPAKPKKEKF